MTDAPKDTTATDAPQWTSTPPSERGQWWGKPSAMAGEWLVDCRRKNGGVLHGAVMWSGWYAPQKCPEPLPMDSEEWQGWLWWPIPLQPPESP